MWLFIRTSLLRCCYAVGSSAAKSVWRQPVAYHQLHGYSFGKPSCRHISSYISSLGQVTSACASVGRSNLFKLCSICARQSRSVKLLRPQRCASVKQLRHASSTKASPMVASSSVRQASKREIPKASDVYRLLSLAKPEKWKLLGENTPSIVLYYSA